MKIGDFQQFPIASKTSNDTGSNPVGGVNTHEKMAKKTKKKSRKNKPKKMLKRFKVCDVHLQEHADGEFILSYKICTGFDKRDVVMMLRDVASDLKRSIKSKK